MQNDLNSCTVFSVFLLLARIPFSHHCVKFTNGWQGRLSLYFGGAYAPPYNREGKKGLAIKGQNFLKENYCSESAASSKKSRQIFSRGKICIIVPGSDGYSPLVDSKVSARTCRRRNSAHCSLFYNRTCQQEHCVCLQAPAVNLSARLCIDQHDDAVNL